MVQIRSLSLIMKLLKKAHTRLSQEFGQRSRMERHSGLLLNQHLQWKNLLENHTIFSRNWDCSLTSPTRMYRRIHTNASEWQCWWESCRSSISWAASETTNNWCKTSTCLFSQYRWCSFSLHPTSPRTQFLLTDLKGLANRRKINSSSSPSPWCFKFYLQLPSCTILLEK